MSLVISISGIRGTIGGKSGDALTPIEIVNFSAAYSKWLYNQYQNDSLKVVIGRDSRISGPIVSQLVANTLIACGIDVIDLELATTPTVEMAVPHFHAHGGIIITASHNPANWNALKLLNNKGEFISAAEGEKLLNIIHEKDFIFAKVEQLGSYSIFDFTDNHINAILDLPLVNVSAIKEKRYKVVVDTINSVGAIAIPKLLDALGVDYILLNGAINGDFAHNPEPLEKNLLTTINSIKKHQVDMGIVVDPDVDRLAFIDEHGVMFGEEYSLVAIADYILKHHKGATVSNLSSSRALRDVTLDYKQQYYAAAVGEVNVVNVMKQTNAIIGGEGNGGIIYPPLHYGRDALVGIALFLSHLSEQGISVSQLKKRYPYYEMVKSKIELNESVDIDSILNKIISAFNNHGVNTVDGVKIDFDEGWVHLRKSNTEPIIRIYAEARDVATAENLIRKITDLI